MKGNRVLEIIGIVVSFAVVVGLTNMAVQSMVSGQLDRIEDPSTPIQLELDEQDMYERYTGSCLSEGFPESFCECSFNTIKDNYGIEEFIHSASEALKTGEPTSALYEAVDRCEYLLEDY